MYLNLLFAHIRAIPPDPTFHRQVSTTCRHLSTCILHKPGFTPHPPTYAYLLSPLPQLQYTCSSTSLSRANHSTRAPLPTVRFAPQRQPPQLSLFGANIKHIWYSRYSLVIFRNETMVGIRRSERDDPYDLRYVGTFGDSNWSLGIRCHFFVINLMKCTLDEAFQNNEGKTCRLIAPCTVFSVLIMIFALPSRPSQMSTFMPCMLRSYAHRHVWRCYLPLQIIWQTHHVVCIMVSRNGWRIFNAPS